MTTNERGLICNFKINRIGLKQLPKRLVTIPNTAGTPKAIVITVSNCDNRINCFQSPKSTVWRVNLTVNINQRATLRSIKMVIKIRFQKHFKDCENESGSDFVQKESNNFFLISGVIRTLPTIVFAVLLGGKLDRFENDILLQTD